METRLGRQRNPGILKSPIIHGRRGKIQSTCNENLLSLVRDVESLLGGTDSHGGCGFFGCDGVLLVLKLDPGDGNDPSVADVLEAVEVLEHVGQGILVGIGWKIGQEQSLVGPHIFVGNHVDTQMARFLGSGRIGSGFGILLGALEVCPVC